LVVAAAVFRPIATVSFLTGLIAGAVLVVLVATPEQRQRIAHVRPVLAPPLLFLVVAMTVTVSAVTLEAIDPERLPVVTLNTLNEGKVTGDLIVFANGTWYLAGPRHEIIAVDSRELRSATIYPRRGSWHLRQETLPQVILHSL
jgi:hypothetical protein